MCWRSGEICLYTISLKYTHYTCLLTVVNTAVKALEIEMKKSNQDPATDL